jgi:hypothetical protein
MKTSIKEGLEEETIGGRGVGGEGVVEGNKEGRLKGWKEGRKRAMEGGLKEGRCNSDGRQRKEARDVRSPPPLVFCLAALLLPSIIISVLLLSVLSCVLRFCSV